MVFRLSWSTVRFGIDGSNSSGLGLVVNFPRFTGEENSTAVRALFFRSSFYPWLRLTLLCQQLFVEFYYATLTWLCQSYGWDRTTWLLASCPIAIAVNYFSLHLRTLWACILVFSASVCFSLDALIPKLFGSTYVDAVLLSRITMWIAAITSIASIFSQYVISSGNTRLIAVIQTLGLLITLGVALTLIPTYSSLGLLIAQILGATFTLIAYIQPALKDIHQSDRIHLRYLVGLSLNLMAITFLLPFILKNSLLLLACSSLCISATLAILYFQVFTIQERVFVSLAFKKAFTKKIRHL
jgi:hypothetical protein